MPCRLPFDPSGYLNSLEESKYTTSTLLANIVNHLTTRIVEAIAEAEGVDTDQVGFVLYDYVDTDALGQLIENSDDISVTVPVDDYAVKIDDDASVSVSDRATPSRNRVQ